MAPASPAAPAATMPGEMEEWLWLGEGIAAGRGGGGGGVARGETAGEAFVAGC